MFNDRLNDKLFDGLHLRPEVREALLKVADAFQNGLIENDIPADIIDIQLVGSNASFHYSGCDVWVF